MTVYRIAKWSQVFETHESRKYKSLSWVAMPTSFSSHGYQSLLDEFGEDAPALYGAWCALVGFAASCAVRGTLATSRGSAIKVGHIARITGFRGAVFEKLIEWATSEEVGWIVPAQPHEIPCNTGEDNDLENPPGTPGESPGAPGKKPLYITAQHSTEHNQQQQLTGRNATTRQAAAGLPPLNLEKVAGNAVVDLANELVQIRRGVLGKDVDWLWQACWIATAIDGGDRLRQVGSDISSRRGDDYIQNPKKYIDSVIRLACEELGESYISLKRLVPKRPETKEACAVR